MQAEAIKIKNEGDDSANHFNAFLMHLGAFNRECLPVERYSDTASYTY